MIVKKTNIVYFTQKLKYVISLGYQLIALNVVSKIVLFQINSPLLYNKITIIQYYKFTCKNV